MQFMQIQEEGQEDEKIFVYGSLKRNEYNYPRFLDDPKTNFLGEKTVDEFTLYSLGSYPTAVESKGGYIVGEMFSVTNKIFERIKSMELTAGYKMILVDDCYMFYMDKKKLNLDYARKIGSVWNYKQHGR